MFLKKKKQKKNGFVKKIVMKLTPRNLKRKNIQGADLQKKPKPKTKSPRTGLQKKNPGRSSNQSRPKSKRSDLQKKPKSKRPTKEKKASQNPKARQSTKEKSNVLD